MPKKLGIDLFPTYNEGENVYLADGNRSTFSDTGATGSAPNDPALLPDLALVIGDLDSKSLEVPVDAPWNAARAGEYDGQTLETYVNAMALTPQFKALGAAATRPIFGAEPRELSLLFVLFYIAASGNETTPGTFERNFNTRAGGQESRFVGGSALITARLAKKLGRRIVLRSPVRRIEQDKGGVRVVSDRVTVDAKRVIVAIPPTLAGRIDYRPDLPSDRDALTQRVPQGRLIKATAVYDEPFWREDGLTGQSLSTDGYVSATFDDSPEDGSPGVVFGFIGGDRARAFRGLSDCERRTAALGDLAAAFGDKAKTPKGFFLSQWTEETWSRGCPVGLYGAWHAGGLRRPDPQARGPHPLGRHGDVDLLERLHGRRGPLRRARGRRGHR